MASGTDLDKFTCSVCLELFSSPVITSCGHTFCSSCLATSVETTGNDICPMCRQSIDKSMTRDDEKMKNDMGRTKTKCKNCGITVVILLLKRHQQSCSLLGATGVSLPRAQGASAKGGASNVYTFPCPYCSKKNLDCSGMIKHVNELHKGDRTQVVCPICSSMPWGNPEQTSANFIDHINLRHRFEYDRFVDFRLSDEQSLDQAMAKSAQEF